MKKMLFTLLFLLIVAPTANAHTNLKETAPAHGEVIATSLSEISLTYAGNIEEGSNFDIKNELGEVFTVASLTVDNGVMTGKLSKPLPNGTYTVEWNSISEDGHPLNGSFTFTVDVAESTSLTTTDEEIESEPITTEQTTEVNETEDLADEKSNTPILIVVAVLVIVIFGSMIVLFTRKKS